MKKTLLVLLVLTLAVSSAFCASSKKFSKYESMLNSGEYTLKGALYPLDYAGNPNRSSDDGGAITVSEHAGQYYMEMAQSYNSIKILIKEDKVYTMDDMSGLCMVMALDDSDMGIVTIDADFDVMESGTAKFDGKNLSYEKAQEGNVTTTYWYNGNDLYAISTVEAGSYGERTVLIIDSLKSGADASLFEIPESYEILDLTSLYSWAEDDYDWYSDYDYSDWYSDDDYDWYSDYDYDWDWGYAEPDYYALGRLFGLSDSQASSFSYAVELMEYIDWDALQSYYNSDTYTYDMTTRDFQNVNYLDSYDIAQIQKLVNAFR